MTSMNVTSQLPPARTYGFPRRVRLQKAPAPRGMHGWAAVRGGRLLGWVQWRDGDGWTVWAVHPRHRPDLQALLHPPADRLLEPGRRAGAARHPSLQGGSLTSAGIDGWSRRWWAQRLDAADDHHDLPTALRLLAAHLSVQRPRRQQLELILDRSKDRAKVLVLDVLLMALAALPGIAAATSDGLSPLERVCLSIAALALAGTGLRNLRRDLAKLRDRPTEPRPPLN